MPQPGPADPQTAALRGACWTFIRKVSAAAVDFNTEVETIQLGGPSQVMIGRSRSLDDATFALAVNSVVGSKRGRDGADIRLAESTAMHFQVPDSLRNQQEPALPKVAAARHSRQELRRLGVAWQAQMPARSVYPMPVGELALPFQPHAQTASDSSNATGDPLLRTALGPARPDTTGSPPLQPRPSVRRRCTPESVADHSPHPLLRKHSSGINGLIEAIHILDGGADSAQQQSEPQQHDSDHGSTDAWTSGSDAEAIEAQAAAHAPEPSAAGTQNPHAHQSQPIAIPTRAGLHRRCFSLPSAAVATADEGGEEDDGHAWDAELPGVCDNDDQPGPSTHQPASQSQDSNAPHAAEPSSMGPSTPGAKGQRSARSRGRAAQPLPHDNSRLGSWTDSEKQALIALVQEWKPCGAADWERVADKLGRWSRGGASAERMYRTLTDPGYQKTTNKHGRRINPRQGTAMHVMATYALRQLPGMEGNLSQIADLITSNEEFAKELDWSPRPGTKTYPRWKDALVGCFKQGRYPHLVKTDRKLNGLNVYHLDESLIKS